MEDSVAKSIESAGSARNVEQSAQSAQDAQTERAQTEQSAQSAKSARTAYGEVIKLDRSLPTVKLEDGRTLLCEHATTLTKAADMQARAVIGDAVEVLIPDDHDAGIITKILPRRTQFIRKDPTERTLPQVLAANFNQIMIVQPIGQLNMRRLERELVLAFETGAQVAIVLTKADLAQASDSCADAVQELAGPDVPVLVISSKDEPSIEKVSVLMPAGSTTVLMGRSGVGKSTLVNALHGSEVQRTADVRSTDGKGRHTTVNRQIIELPNGARIIDMPGVRGLGLWEATTGLDTAFADIEALAADCRFRDCQHINEPGCAVRAAIDSGQLSQQRYDSYINLRQEAATTEKRRQQKGWKRRR